MTSTTNKTVKRRIARRKAKAAEQASPGAASDTGPPQTSFVQRSSQMSQAVTDNVILNQTGDRAPTTGPVRPARSGRFDSWTRAQLELKIKTAKANLHVERAQFSHWKREVDKYDAAEATSETWNFPEQTPYATPYDHEVVQKMLELSHRAVRKLENELWATEQKLGYILSSMSEIEGEK